MSWAQALSRYLELEKGRGLAAGTLAGIVRVVGRFQDFCGVDLPEVLDSQLAAYREELEWTPTARGGLLAPSTVTGHLHTLRSFFQWAHREGWVLIDPARNLVIKKPPQPLPRLLTVEEAQGLVEVPDPATPLGQRDRALLETLYGAGLRRSECCALDLADLDWHQLVLRVRPGKTRTARLLPLGPHLAEVLQAYLREGRPELAKRPGEPALFLSRLGRRLSLPRLEQIVHAAARRLGLGNVGPHALRHAGATHLLARGADLVQVQAWLGHQSVKSTETYTHLVPIQLFWEHGRTHPRARRR